MLLILIKADYVISAMSKYICIVFSVVFIQ